MHEALKGKLKKPKDMSNDNWEELGSKVTSAIRLSVADLVLYNVMKVSPTKELWNKLMGIYMKKLL